MRQRIRRESFRNENKMEKNAQGYIATHLYNPLKIRIKAGFYIKN